MTNFNPHGLSAESLAIIKSILESNFKNGQAAHVYVFGSRATGKQRQYSDLDLWIEASPVLSEQKISLLNQAFIDSDLPIKIDIVTPQNCLEEYLKSIESQKVLWFEIS